MWFLEICTAGFLLCGQYRVVPYPDEQACYRAVDELYKRQGREAFKYVLCWQNNPERKP